ncbi:beta-L-arabinofuranosidase domain-containing protein [Verrucomicrobiota bacterium]
MMNEHPRDRVSDKVDILPVGAWRFEGHIGERLDTVAKARLTTESAWNALYPQTENAFRERSDDRSHAPNGVWRGEFWGKYILGAIAACRYYGSAELKERIRAAVKGLLSTQDNDGYIGTYRDSGFFGPNTWNIWCRKYVLWGLIESWELLGDDAILEAAIRFADHLLSQVGKGKHEIIRTGQFNGLPSTSILKPVVDLYRATGTDRYVQFAEYIVAQWGRHPHGPPDLLASALQGEPIHTWFPHSEEWAKSYEFLSCAEGLLELYRVTGRSDYLTAAQAIHRLVAQWERNPAGGVSFNDKFVGARFLINSVAEVCDSVYWNRLSIQLLRLTGEVRYLDEIERVLYNALLCGMAPDGYWGLRRLRLTHLHVPAHRHFLEGHQCCVDNAPRGLFQATQSAVFRTDDGCRIALYEPGSGRLALPSGQPLDLNVQGDFPDTGTVSIRVGLQTPETFTVCLRLPFWSRRTAVQVNREPMPVGDRKDWCRIEREWRAGDEIGVELDLSPRFECFDPSVFSDTDPRTLWHRRKWAKIALLGEDNAPAAGGRSQPLSVAQSLPQQSAAMAFRGPVALARDVRIGDGDIVAPVTSAALEEDAIRFEQRCAPEGIRRAYDLVLKTGESVRLCDFASAGNTWTEESTFSAWLLGLHRT